MYKGLYESVKETKTLLLSKAVLVVKSCCNRTGDPQHVGAPTQRLVESEGLPVNLRGVTARSLHLGAFVELGPESELVKGPQMQPIHNGPSLDSIAKSDGLHLSKVIRQSGYQNLYCNSLPCRPPTLVFLLYRAVCSCSDLLSAVAGPPSGHDKS